MTTRLCPFCEGTGFEVVATVEDVKPPDDRWITSRIIETAPCPHCGGAGELTREPGAAS